MEWDALACVPCTRGEDKATFSLINAFFNIFQSLENFESIDYAVYKAGQLGLKLIVPLTGKFMNQNKDINIELINNDKNCDYNSWDPTSDRFPRPIFTPQIKHSSNSIFISERIKKKY